MTTAVRQARQAMQSAQDAYEHATRARVPAEVLEDLAEDLADAEAAYFRACDAAVPAVTCARAA